MKLKDFELKNQELEEKCRRLSAKNDENQAKLQTFLQRNESLLRENRDLLRKHETLRADRENFEALLQKKLLSKQNLRKNQENSAFLEKREKKEYKSKAKRYKSLYKELLLQENAKEARIQDLLQEIQQVSQDSQAKLQENTETFDKKLVFL